MKKHIALAGLFALGAAEACSPATQATAPAKAAETAKAEPVAQQVPTATAIAQEAPAAKEFRAAECPIVEVKSCMDQPLVLADKEALKTRTVEINGQKQVQQGELSGVHVCKEEKTPEGRLERLKYSLMVDFDVTVNPDAERLTERVTTKVSCVPNYAATSCDELLVCHKFPESTIISRPPLSERDRTRRDGGPIGPKQ